MEVTTIGKLDKLYINYASKRLLKRSKNYFIEYKNQISPNNSHIHLRSGDAASSYNFPFQLLDQRFQNETVFLIVVLVFQG